MTDRATIPDYSYWNGEVDFNKAKAKGAPGVILRASWGMYADSMFEVYRNQCDSIKLPWIAYHYRDYRWSLDANLTAFRNALSGRFGCREVMDLEQDPSTYPLKAIRAILPHETPEQAMDIMPFTRQTIGATTQPLNYSVSRPANYSLTPPQVQTDTWNFLTQTEAFTGITPWLYTGFFYWSTWGTPEAKWLHFPLWEAWYTTNESYVQIPKPWTVKTAWQYTGNGSGPDWGSTGLSQDLSLYYGTVEQFNNDMKINNVTTAHDLSVHAPHYCAVCGAQLADIDVNPIPPTPPPTVAYVVLAGHYPNVRKEAQSTSALILPSPMQPGYKLFVDKQQPVDATHANAYSHFVPDTVYPNGGWVWTDTIVRV